MDFLWLFTTLNSYLDIPITFLFLFVSILVTFWCGLPQIFALPRAFSFLTKGFPRAHDTSAQTISAMHALFTSMGTSIGMGTIIGPSLAIVVGGPGALFWLLVYDFFGAALKLVEVTFALNFRHKTADGRIIGGPAVYLRAISPLLANWYGLAALVIFAGWSGIQAKALAEVLSVQAIPEWISGLTLAITVFIVLIGGAQRVGTVASKIVPLMFLIYVSSSLWILLSNALQTWHALQLIFSHILTPTAPIGGFLGSSLFAAIRQGVYKGVFITESGMGTSSIAHALSDAKYPVDQGILAMVSVAADSFLCTLSGLLVLTTGIWVKGIYSNTLVYSVFQDYFPSFGPLFFVISLCLFIISTAIGNAFNGGQNFAIFTHYRGITWYYAFVAVIIFVSAIINVPLIWAIMDFVLPFVAIPNLIGITLLAFKYPQILQYKKG